MIDINEIIGLLDDVIDVCHGKIGPELAGEHETDARYVYPEKMDWIETNVKKAIYLIEGIF